LNKKIQKIKLTTNDNYTAFAIISSEKEHKLCWALNSSFNISLSRRTIADGTQTIDFFAFLDEKNLSEYFFIPNKSESLTIIKESKQTDYFFVIRNSYRSVDEINGVLRNMPINQAVYWLDDIPAKLKRLFSS